MSLVRFLKLAAFGSLFVTSIIAQNAKAGEQGEISLRGEARPIVHRSRVEVVELRGARQDPDFVESSYHKSEVRDVARWNQQHDHITPVRGVHHLAHTPEASGKMRAVASSSQTKERHTFAA